ncbi:hypothetical protein, partial [Halorhabdus tiamatea]|uniref:hypothetical protein n=1 Tax=Halorhabdus tiamatea TaxID=430914 RepID=UPI001A7E4446
NSRPLCDTTEKLLSSDRVECSRVIHNTGEIFDDPLPHAGHASTYSYINTGVLKNILVEKD